MVLRVASNFFSLKRRLEMKKNRRYSYKEIGVATGLHPATIAALDNGRDRGVRFQTIAALLQFFNQEGLPTHINDLFVVKEE